MRVCVSMAFDRFLVVGRHGMQEVRFAHPVMATGEVEHDAPAEEAIAACAEGLVRLFREQRFFVTDVKASDIFAMEVQGIETTIAPDDKKLGEGGDKNEP